MEVYTDAVEQYADFAAYARGDSPVLRGVGARRRGRPRGARLDRRRCPASSGSRTWCSPRRAGTASPRPGRTTRCARRCSATTARIRAHDPRAGDPDQRGRPAGDAGAGVRGRSAGGGPLALLEVGRERRAVPLPRPLLLRVGDRRRATVAAGAGPRRWPARVDGPAPLPGRAAGGRLARRRRPQPARRHRRRRDGLADDPGLARARRPARRCWPRRSRSPAPTRRELVRGDLLERAAGAGRARRPRTARWWSSTARSSPTSSPTDRRASSELMTGLVRRRPLPLGQQRGPAGAARRDRDRAGGARRRCATFVLGVDGRAVAWTHGHGRSMTWLG